MFGSEDGMDVIRVRRVFVRCGENAVKAVNCRVVFI
jgi:hypothetical protein